MKVKPVKKLTILEITILLLSLIAGLFLTYESIYDIYVYNFTSVLVYIELPMTIIISDLLIGLLLLYSGLSFILNSKSVTFFYKLSGIIIMLFPINLIILNALYAWSIRSLIGLILFPVGLILYIYFNQKKYEHFEQIFALLKPDKIKFVLGLFAFLLIDCFFYKWTY